MRLHIRYRKSLHLSPGKLAAQAVHAAFGLGYKGDAEAVIVLGISDTKFHETKSKGYVVTDAGYTEVAPGTETCFAFYEQ